MGSSGTVSEGGNPNRRDLGDPMMTSEAAEPSRSALLVAPDDVTRLASDEAARIYECEVDRVRRYVAFRVRDPRDVEDLTADVFRRLVCGPVPAVPGAWTAWLLRVAHNAVVDHYRRRRQFDPLALVLDRPDDAPPLDERVAFDEQLRSVGDALRGLPGRQRAAVYLRYTEGLGYDEISDVLRVSRVAARTLVHRGLRSIAARMAGEESR
jgi:RNA polymerase sigma-70 factor, ECF subfamily